MNILLTGGAGFIGSHTAVELLNAGHHVIVVDNLYNSSEKVIERVEELTGKKVRFYNANACDFDAMDKIFAENEVDAVIHFAAYKAVGESVSKPLEYYRNNLDCTLTVCEAMKKHGVTRFIFQLVCDGVRNSGSHAAGRNHADQLHQPVWLDEVHE